VINELSITVPRPMDPSTDAHCLIGIRSPIDRASMYCMCSYIWFITLHETGKFFDELAGFFDYSL
jgi:hypothetical protein